MLRAFFNRKPELKSSREIGLMREAGKLVAVALRIAREVSGQGDIEQIYANILHVLKPQETPPC